MRLHELPVPGNTITDHVRRWRDERRVTSLLRAGYCVVRQGRLMELLYGLYCMAITRPSAVQPQASDSIRTILRGLRLRLIASTASLSRRQLIDALGHRYAVAELPADFEQCRSQAVAEIGSRLVLGEYGENASRIAVVSRERCEVFSPYERTRGVRHIHLVCATGITDELFVTTGDATKVLDRLTIGDGTPCLVVRHRARLGGHTAAADVGGEFFFGTDFSGRPNYIETLRGEKYFLPSGAYSKYVVSLTAVWPRYLVALSRDIGKACEGQTVSVFDVCERTFVLCESWSDLFGTSSA